MENKAAPREDLEGVTGKGSEEAAKKMGGVGKRAVKGREEGVRQVLARL